MVADYISTSMAGSSTDPIMPLVVKIDSLNIGHQSTPPALSSTISTGSSSPKSSPQRRRLSPSPRTAAARMGNNNNASLENSFIDFSDTENCDAIGKPIVDKQPVVTERGSLEYESNISLFVKSEKGERRKRCKKGPKSQIIKLKHGSLIITDDVLGQIEMEQEEAASKNDLKLNETIESRFGKDKKKKHKRTRARSRNLNKIDEYEEEYQEVPAPPKPQQSLAPKSTGMHKYRKDRELAEAEEFANFDWGASFEETEGQFNNELLIKIARGQKVSPSPDDVAIIDNEQNVVDIQRHNQIEVNKILSLMNNDETVPSHEQLCEEEEHPNDIQDKPSLLTKFEKVDNVPESSQISCFKSIEKQPPRTIPRPTKSRPFAFESYASTQPIPLSDGNRSNPPDPLHIMLCLTCGQGAGHAQIDCVEHPRFKLEQIRRKKLCKKCLNFEHSYAFCRRKDIVCSVCGMDHLDYIYHQGEWLLPSPMPDPFETSPTAESLPQPTLVPNSSNVCPTYSSSGFSTCIVESNVNSIFVSSPKREMESDTLVANKKAKHATEILESATMIVSPASDSSEPSSTLSAQARAEIVDLFGIADDYIPASKHSDQVPLIEWSSSSEESITSLGQNLVCPAEQNDISDKNEIHVNNEARGSQVTDPFSSQPKSNPVNAMYQIGSGRPRSFLK